MNPFKTFTFLLILCGSAATAQTSYFMADFYIDGEKAQDQYYKVEEKAGITTVQERGIFLSNKEIYAYAESKMDSLGYISVKIAFDNGSIKSVVKVNRSKKNPQIYYSYKNEVLVDSLRVKESSLLLFDGPNPSFDALNAKFLEEHKTQSITLGLINWVSGSLSTEEAYFIFGKQEAASHKMETQRIGFLTFKTKQILPDTCYQNAESYVFRKVESLLVSLEK